MKTLSKIGLLTIGCLGGGLVAQVFTGMITSGIGSGIVGNPASAQGGNFSAAAPYYSNGTHSYVAATGYQATFPSGTPTWINSVTPTVTAGTNGDLLFTGTGAYWAELSGTTSTEAEFSSSSSATAATDVGIWMYDSTNSRIWAFSIEAETTSSPALIVNSYVYSGTGNPSFQMNWLKAVLAPSQVLHFKLSKVSTTLHFQVSLNGGANFTDVLTESVGTLADGGYFGVGAGGSGAVIGDIYSLVVN